MPTGVYIRTEQTLKRLSEARKGKVLSKEHKEKIADAHRGKPSGMLGKTQSQEQRYKVRVALKGRKRPPFSKKWRENLSKANFQRYIKYPELKNKLRIARLKQILPTSDTSIELKVKNYLDNKGVNYIHPFNLGDRFQCDFYIPFLNLIVECDGTYWHSRPDMKRRDKGKDGYAKKCGFNILRLTEEQINKGNFEIVL